MTAKDGARPNTKNPVSGSADAGEGLWDFASVFVVGTSACPQNAGRNPTGAVGALAYRAADGIVNKHVKWPGSLV